MKAVGFAVGAAVALVLTGAVSADEVNLLAGYGSADWQGDTVVYDNASGAVYFDNDGSGEKSALLEIEADGTDSGVYFCIDAGNGMNTSDSGYCTLEFCGEDGEVLYSVSTGSISGLESFSRFYLGSEESYYPLPEGTEKLVISIHAVPTGDKGRVNVYFRNFTLRLSGEMPLGGAEDTVYMKSIAGLSKVEVGTGSAVRWIWIGIVFVVAMVFYFVRMWREKYRTAEVMKSGERKR